MKNTSLRRVLSLDIRSRRFGYVIFEGSHTLLDWGVRTYDVRSSLERKLDVLQSMFRPSLILIRESGQSLNRPTLTIAKSFARRTSIAVRSLDEPSLRSFFSTGTKVNKHDIARIVAERFPELSWRLPPERKPWQTEPRRQSIFDAASLGVFFFARQAAIQQASVPAVD